MNDFAARAREALKAKGLSMRGAARALPYDIAYVSRVLNGKQQPSAKLAEGLDELLEADGALAAWLEPRPASARPAEDGGGVEADIAHLRDSVAHLLDHDHRYGSDQIASAAAQVWRTAQRKLDSGTVPDGAQREYLSATAEAAEVTGWLLFDAGRPEAARTATLEAQTLARHAGDRPMQWFTLDMLAMQDIGNDRPGEAVRIADELLSRLRVPPRVALLARVRRGRALARIGERRRALSDMEAARAALDDSIAARDPAWTWWVNEREFSGHEGRVFLVLGEFDKAVSRLHRARELAEAAQPAGRWLPHHSIGEAEAYAASHAWRECEETLLSIPPALDAISSGRARRRLLLALRNIVRDADAPAWLRDLARDMANTPQLASG